MMFWSGKLMLCIGYWSIPWGDWDGNLPTLRKRGFHSEALPGREPLYPLRSIFLRFGQSDLCDPPKAYMQEVWAGVGVHRGKDMVAGLPGLHLLPPVQGKCPNT